MNEFVEICICCTKINKQRNLVGVGQLGPGSVNLLEGVWFGPPLYIEMASSHIHAV